MNLYYSNLSTLKITLLKNCKICYVFSHTSYTTQNKNALPFQIDDTMTQSSNFNEKLCFVPSTRFYLKRMLFFFVLFAGTL